MGQGSKEADEGPGGPGSRALGGGTSSLHDMSDIRLAVRRAAPKISTLSASLQQVGQRQTDTLNWPLPPVFYVIVGCGPGSVINHTTLNQTPFGEKRLNDSMAGEIPVIHVGFSNPWSNHFLHGMGQRNYLLSLPGFDAANQPTNGPPAEKDGGMRSLHFGSCVDRELVRCKTVEEARFESFNTRIRALGWPVLKGWVAWVQSRALEPLGHADKFPEELTGTKIQAAIEAKILEPYPIFIDGVAPYRVLVLRELEDGSLEPIFLYAQFIDFCTGSGRPRQDNKSFKTARLEPWRDPETWKEPEKARKILVAEEAIGEELPFGGATERICVANGGAIALNAAEKARDAGCWTDWFHVPDLVASFGNPRNVAFLWDSGTNLPRVAGIKLTAAHMLATYEKTRLGGSAAVASATEGGGGVNVTLEKGKARPGSTAVVAEPRIRDHQGNGNDLSGGMWLASDWYAGEYATATTRALPSDRYDRLILHAGLVNDQVGRPAWAIPIPLAPLLKGDRLIGLQTSDGHIRVLGAAAQAPDMPAIVPSAENPRKKMEAFREGLPVTAVPEGFILSGINIAEANEFFKAFPNKNWNTMELKEVEKEVNLSDPLKGEFMKLFPVARNKGNGFSSLDDMIQKLTREVPGKIEEPRRVAVSEALENLRGALSTAKFTYE